ncbi:MAG: hypothetical protein A4E66_02587 [Syntrophus sp. PtaB.Bin001]|nr:MAG: hypothetical protein A4E66_02587 [Syntrophus sp. PtaB.Bin001]
MKRLPKSAENPINMTAPYRATVRLEMQMLRAKKNADSSINPIPLTEDRERIPDSKAKKQTPVTPSSMANHLRKFQVSPLMKRARIMTKTGLTLKTTAQEAALSIV